MHLIFVEDTLWTGIPRNYTNSDVPEVLSEVRKLVDDGQYVEATTKGVKLLGDPSEVCCLCYLVEFFFLLRKIDKFSQINV